MAEMELVAAVLQNNRANIQRRRARLRRLMAVCLQTERINIYASPNHHVPVVQIYMDQSKDLRFDYRLSRESIEALMTLLRREKTHGWVQHCSTTSASLLETSWSQLRERIQCRYLHRDLRPLLALSLPSLDLSTLCELSFACPLAQVVTALQMCHKTNQSENSRRSILIGWSSPIISSSTI
ncbi:hypothetical protein NQZ68_000861 [Dissostichus eleginoides]|nr:hypothetical protein NQZ68_000861 [Dissostichus eleginoides]